MTESYYEVDAPAQARSARLPASRFDSPAGLRDRIDLMTELTQISLTVPQA